MSSPSESSEKRAKTQLSKCYAQMCESLSQEIVGLDRVVKLLLAGIFSGGHCLLVGVPGLAKTKLISSVAKLLELEFSRIQFTPDLMPSDITGTEVIHDDAESGERGFQFLQGPIFANIVLADEINRTPSKTQAALMEAMEEHQISSLGKRFDLEEPFFVLATQNPIEQEGTYPLPAAQLDRFMFNIFVDYPSRADEEAIVRMTTRGKESQLTPVMTRDEVLEVMQAVRELKVQPAVLKYASDLVRATRPDDPSCPAQVGKYVEFGAGPRAAQSLIMGAKVLAMMRGDDGPNCADIRDLMLPVLRHRIVINFMGTAESIDEDHLLQTLIDSFPAPDGYQPKKPKAKKSFLAALFARE